MHQRLIRLSSTDLLQRLFNQPFQSNDFSLSIFQTIEEAKINTSYYIFDHEINDNSSITIEKKEKDKNDGKWITEKYIERFGKWKNRYVWLKELLFQVNFHFSFPASVFSQLIEFDLENQRND